MLFITKKKKKKGKNETLQADIPLSVEISHVGTKKADTKLNFECTVADEGQLYIKKLRKNEAVLSVWNMKEIHQHKLYDYLQLLGVGDGTANFIQQYNRANYYENHMQSLSEIQKYFLNKE